MARSWPYYIEEIMVTTAACHGPLKGFGFVRASSKGEAAIWLVNLETGHTAKVYMKKSEEDSENERALIAILHHRFKDAIEAIKAKEAA